MKTKLFLALATVGSMLMFSACSNEEMPSGIATQEVRVTMSATIDQPADNLSRNELTEVAPGNINFYWTKGDAVVAVTEGGTVAGVLVAQEGGVASSELSGSLTLKDGDYNLTYYFLGNGVAVPEVGTAFDYTHSIANQSGDASEMKNHGIMATSGSVSISAGVATAQEIMLNHLMTFAHFEMVLAESMKGSSYEVTVSGANVNNTVAVANGAITASNDETGCIKVGNALDFYMTVAPAKQMAFTFTVKVDGDKEYTASLPAVDIAASKFLRADFEEGIPVRFEEPVAPVDHSLNPLNKWAEGNLVYNESTNSSSISTSYYGGSLYQWGRNHGFTNYNDAIGTVNSTGVCYYGTYNQSYDACKGWYSESNKWEYLSAKYTSVSNVRANPDRFLMVAFGDDYWHSSFGDGGSTWSERNTACNELSVLCPDGWRLPTVADCKEIWPISGITTTATGLSAAIENVGAQLREIEGVCKYVIKWDLIGTGTTRRSVKVSALVVPNDFDSSELSSVDWNDENVVVRYFGATGAIEAYYHTHIFTVTGNTDIQYCDVARPMPFGTFNARILEKVSGYNSYITFNYSNIVDAGSTYEGAYWVSDQLNSQPVFFRFRDNQNKFGSSNAESLMGLSNGPAQNAYAIRLVRQ